MKIIKSIFKKIISIKDIIIKIIENIFGNYVTYHFRPKFSTDVNLTADTLKGYPKVSIIIQGPLLKDNKFTLNTIQIYKKIFKDYQIILSTWEDEALDYLAEIKKEGIEIVLNKKPDYPGIQNINFQIVSTLNAIKKAQELGAEYILKTRTDLRIYNPNSIEFLVNLLKAFPAGENTKQKKRLAFPGLNTFKYRPYSVTDLVMFGQTDDIFDYWDVALDNKKPPINDKLIIDWAKARLGEIYLSTNYLEKLGQVLNWTIADSWQIYALHFCIFDTQSLDLYWHKYARNKEYRRLEYKKMKNDKELTHSEWLNLYIGLNNKQNIPEDILNDDFTKKINTFI